MTEQLHDENHDINEDELVDRYVDLWNEADPAQRRATVEALWASDGANYTPTIEAIGFDQIDQRVTRSYDKYIGTGQFRFRRGGPALAHHQAVKVQWEMVETATDGVASVGLEFLVLDDDGRIRSDHQFVVS
jgi:hypothetical protein